MVRCCDPVLHFTVFSHIHVCGIKPRIFPRFAEMWDTALKDTMVLFTQCVPTRPTVAMGSNANTRRSRCCIPHFDDRLPRRP
jgi:hypothetical protein